MLSSLSNVLKASGFGMLMRNGVRIMPLKNSMALQPDWYAYWRTMRHEQKKS
jgi:hypothetical protein